MSQGPPPGGPPQGHPGPPGPPPPMMHMHPMQMQQMQQMHPMMMQQMMMEQSVQAPPAPKDDEPTPICRYLLTYLPTWVGAVRKLRDNLGVLSWSAKCLLKYRYPI